MITVRIRNYQSIEAADLEVSGLTVLTGSNNSGKSAIFRAIHGVFTNTRGNRFVRKGKDYCTVSLDFHDGQSVMWEKGASVNRYRINGKELNKVSQKVPDEVVQMGVVPVNLSGRDPIWPQFAHQFNGQVFLLDAPGSVLAEAIADVDRVGVLNEALRQAQSDYRSATSELKVRQGDVGRLETQESTFQGLDEIEERANALVVLGAEIEKTTTTLNDVIRIRDRQLSLSKVCSLLQPIRLIESPVPDAKLGKLQSAYEWALGMRERLEGAQTQVRMWRDRSDILESIQLPPPPNMTSEVRDLDQARSISEGLRVANATISNILVDLEKARLELATVEGELSNLMGKIETCPFCGSLTEKSHDHP